MKTKILSMLLVMVMILGMLASCGDNEDDPDDSGNTPGGTVTPPSGGTTGGEDYAWDYDTIVFQMNKNSHGRQLTSGCERYLAGQDENASDLLDFEVMARNGDALLETNLDVQYEYWEEGNSSYGWGQTIDDISTFLMGNASDCPDMFCTFIFDMMSSSLKMSFANLKSQSRGANYFEFLDEDYNENEDDRGYMAEMMQSLTLSTNKMYLLGSDYFIDTVRAFFIVPANVKMLNGIEVATGEENIALEDRHAYNSDRNGDGDFSVEDFIDLIWDRDWTYDTIIDFSAKVYSDDDGDDAKSAGDTLGFALEYQSGFSPSGALFTSTVKIIDREVVNGQWTYSYPEENEDLYDFANRITTLFASTGVFASYAPNANSFKSTLGSETDLLGIRARFIENKLLFGGFIMTGNLEDTEYQTMRESEGFCIAPGPLYKAIEEGENRDYQTQIHNVGRLGAISAKTTKFSQCTAFLNYQSTHSTDILDTYYEEKLTILAAGEENGNADTMRFIRKNVRSAFDKAFEDAIGFYFESQDDESTAKKWASIICSGGFVIGDGMATRYDDLRDEKVSRIKTLHDFYEELPD